MSQRSSQFLLTQVNDELGDLHDRDIFLPPDSHTPRALEVVPVHDGVDGQVQGNGHPRHRSLTDHLHIAKERRRSMMIGV